MVYNLVQQVTVCCTCSTSCRRRCAAAAAAEMARVLKPGGLLVLTDSIQLGDRARIDANLVMFETFNEPYYRSFISEDFGAPSRAFPSVAPFGTCMPISLGVFIPKASMLDFAQVKQLVAASCLKNERENSCVSRVYMRLR